MMPLKQAIAVVKEGRQDYRAVWAVFMQKYPTVMSALRIIDLECGGPRERKGYNLVKRENKKLGFIYYVRYFHKGKMLPSKWNTNTNLREETERFARENKERLVEKYLRSHDTKAYELYEVFFSKGSPFLACEGRRNRPLCESTRASYHSVITNKFVPFLKERKITAYDGISVNALSDFQDALLAGRPEKKIEGVKPQSANDDLKAVRMVFAYLERKGLVKSNPLPGPAEYNGAPKRPRSQGLLRNWQAQGGV
jgi:hypothetical protein